jgi:hypothetical protein
LVYYSEDAGKCINLATPGGYPANYPKSYRTKNADYSYVSMQGTAT